MKIPPLLTLGSPLSAPYRHLGILAAFAVSTVMLMIYTNRRRTVSCGPANCTKQDTRAPYRFKCPLNFLTCGTDSSIATVLPGDDDNTDQQEVYLDCNMADNPVASSSLAKGADTKQGEEQFVTEICLHCEERRFMNVSGRGQMSECSCSNLAGPLQLPQPAPEISLVEESGNESGAYASDSELQEHPIANSEELPDPGFLNGPEKGERTPPPAFKPYSTTETMGKSFLYVVFWYISSSGYELYKQSSTGEKMTYFPAPRLLQALYFGLQALASVLFGQNWGQRPALAGISWKSYFMKVVPTAVATAVDINIGLPHKSIPEDFKIMCKSAAPLFVLLLTYAFHLEVPSFKLTASILSLTTGTLLTVGKALDHNLKVIDLCLLMLAAFVSAFPLDQYPGPPAGLATPFSTMHELKPVMAIVAIVISFYTESWQALGEHRHLETRQNILMTTFVTAVGCALATLKTVAELVLVAQTSAVTFIVAVMVKDIASVLVKLINKGWSFEDRVSIKEEYAMNEETTGSLRNGEATGLHYVVLGLVLFLWHRYQRWEEIRGRIQVDNRGGLINLSQPVDDDNPSQFALSPKHEHLESDQDWH